MSSGKYSPVHSCSCVVYSLYSWSGTNFYLNQPHDVICVKLVVPFFFFFFMVATVRCHFLFLGCLKYIWKVWFRTWCIRFGSSAELHESIQSKVFKETRLVADDSVWELHRLRTPVVDELFGMKPPHMCFSFLFFFVFFVDSRLLFTCSWFLFMYLQNFQK